MSFYNLGSAQNVTVNGGGENVGLGDLGTTGSNGTPVLNLDVNDVNNFSVGDLKAGLGANIQASIAAEGTVTIGDIETSTNAQGNVQGDVFLEVSGASFNTGGSHIGGGDLNIDFSGISGNASGYGVGDNGHSIVLAAQESITYQGSGAVDNIKVTGVGAGSHSVIDPGAGRDTITLEAWTYGQDKTSYIDINLADSVSSDTLKLSSSSFANGGVRVSPLSM